VEILDNKIIIIVCLDKFTYSKIYISIYKYFIIPFFFLQVNKIYITPNNIGATLFPQVEFVDLDVNNFEV